MFEACPMRGNRKTGTISISDFGLKTLAQYEKKHKLQAVVKWRELGNSYRTDGKRLYWGSTLVRGGDASTFKILNHIWACDAKNVYCHASKLSANRKTFKAGLFN